MIRAWRAKIVWRSRRRFFWARKPARTRAPPRLLRPTPEPAARQSRQSDAPLSSQGCHASECGTRRQWLSKSGKIGKIGKMGKMGKIGKMGKMGKIGKMVKIGNGLQATIGNRSLY